jgi:GNAT superfamily N-acetyltransferase
MILCGHMLPSQGPSVREPTLDDVDELARINIETWRDAYAGIVPQARLDGMDRATYRERWVSTVTGGRPGVRCVVAEVDRVLAAYAVGGAYRIQEDADPEDTSRWAELFAIYVDPPMQGRRVGVAAHDALLAGLAGEGYVEAALWVLEANAASRSWYAARGWLPDGATSLWWCEGQALPEIRLRLGLAGR